MFRRVEGPAAVARGREQHTLHTACVWVQRLPLHLERSSVFSLFCLQQTVSLFAMRSSRFVLLRTRRYSVWEAAQHPVHTTLPERQLADPAATHKALLALLDSRSVQYTLTHHEEVRTSEEAAAIRGATLASGAKAMLLAKDAHSFVLIVLSASEKLSWSKARKLFGKKLNLATEEQVVECTGCLPGVKALLVCS